MQSEKATNSEPKHGKHSLPFKINGKEFQREDQYITGEELRNLGGISADQLLFLAVKKPWEDELIENNTKVNLARPEREDFYSRAKETKVALIVNGREKSWNAQTISFEEIVKLAFGVYDSNPNKVYTVTYDRGPHGNPEGSMVRSDIVYVKNKMIFNVTATDKS